MNKQGWGGYTKRWRKRWDKGYHQDFLLFIMMDYFIDFAQWEDKEFPFIWKGKLVEMIQLKRGQCFFTMKGLAEFFNGPKNKVSRKMVRDRVKMLEKIGFLARQCARQYQIVTIINYNKYNPSNEREAHQSARQSARQSPTNPPVNPPTYKEYKEYKEREPENPQEIIDQSIAHLNLKAGVKFNPDIYATQTLLIDRINEGFTLDDFKAVIDKKCAQWLTDARMVGNLRPGTLFASDKFEAYLQEARRNGNNSGRQRSHKLTGIELIGMGYDVLTKFGEDKFKEFCDLNKMPANDVAAIRRRGGDNTWVMK